ncbi:MAG: YkvA family protein [Longimicrobiales bacterium]|nr:YkvA family protein [Longimicrobiales bacterium]
MNLDDVNAVIESAKARGREGLDRYIQRRLPEATDEQVRETGDVALEIIESVPVFLARARQEAEQRGLQPVVTPILELAARYFLNPVDVIPEMTHGLGGLLDDAYVVLRVLDRLDHGPTPFLGWDLKEPLEFLAGVMGRDTVRRLDLATLRYAEAAEAHYTRVWDEVSARA